MSEKVLIMNNKLDIREVGKEVLSLWGFDDNSDVIEEGINYETERQTHIWNIDNEYILKMTDNEDEMRSNVYISKLILKVGIPGQRVVCNLSGEHYVKIEGKYYGLFTRIKGETLKDYYEGDYIARGIYLGQCLAKLHQGLKSITDELKGNKKLLDNDMIKELTGWVNEEINKYIPKCALDNKKIDTFNSIREYLNNNFKDLYYKLPRQVIHRDFQGENMIFQDGMLAGFIDFDLSQINARIFDLCYLCTGALAKVFDNEYLRGKWVDFSKAIIKGYESKIEITIEEKNSIKYMMYSIELIMVAFFARDGYEKIADINIEIINWIDKCWDNDLEV